MSKKLYCATIVASLGYILVGCNSGGNPNSTNATQTSSHTNNVSKLPNSYSLAEFPSYINVNIVNNSSQLITISVPDSDYLDCKFPGQSNQYNCGGRDGWNDPGKPDALLGQSINPTNSVSFEMIMNYDHAIPASPTISLSVYGNNLPLFGVWEDGTSTPNPQNHYASQYANNILEVQNWDTSNPDNSSLFVGFGNTGGLVENGSYTINSDGNINLTITITSAKPFTRNSTSIAGNSLCTVPTTNCPNTLTAGSTSSIISNNGLYQLVMQTDGNLVIYNNVGKSIWASNTVDTGATYLTLGGDGNLALYEQNGTSVWAINTASEGATYLTLGDDGNLGVYKPDGTPVWTSNSAQTAY